MYYRSLFLFVVASHIHVILNKLTEILPKEFEKENFHATKLLCTDKSKSPQKDGYKIKTSQALWRNLSGFLIHAGQVRLRVFMVIEDSQCKVAYNYHAHSCHDLSKTGEVAFSSITNHSQVAKDE